jgi:hypothetical protein
MEWRARIKLSQPSKGTDKEVETPVMPGFIRGVEDKVLADAIELWLIRPLPPPQNLFRETERVLEAA